MKDSGRLHAAIQREQVRCTNNFLTGEVNYLDMLEYCHKSKTKLPSQIDRYPFLGAVAKETKVFQEGLILKYRTSGLGTPCSTSLLQVVAPIKELCSPLNSITDQSVKVVKRFSSTNEGAMAPRSGDTGHPLEFTVPRLGGVILSNQYCLAYPWPSQLTDESSRNLRQVRCIESN